MDDGRDEQTGEGNSGATAGNGDPRWLRDLGPGHPLSPVPNEESGSVESLDPGDEDGRTTADESAAGAARDSTDAAGAARDSTDATGSTLPVSRRQVLVGGAVAVVAGLAGVGWTLRGGPDGAHGVAESYVEAVADNDWAAAGALFHDRSPVGESDDTYEAFLESEGALESLEELAPTVEGIHDQFHVTDPVAAAESDAELVPDGLDPAAVEEWRQTVAIVGVDIDEPAPLGPPDDADGLADTALASFPLTLVRDDGWHLVEVQTLAFT